MKSIMYLDKYDLRNCVYQGMPVQVTQKSFKGDQSCVQIRRNGHKVWVSAWQVYVV